MWFIQRDKVAGHAKKVVEKIFEHRIRIRQQVEIYDMQCGFMQGKEMIDAVCHKTDAGEI